MKIFSVDAETDGLYGDVWAIGATVLGPKGDWATFSGQLNPDIVTDRWVRKNVVPVVDLFRFESREDLLNAFWEFWLANSEDVLALADFGTPVEAGLFRACVELDAETRWRQGPYPLHELATALLMAGLDPDLDRREFCGRTDLTPHNPVDDALASALCFEQITAGRL